MSRVRPYYAEGSLSVAFYDLVTHLDRDAGADIPIYAELAPPGGAVLELGTGSGRVAFALAEQGLNVTGVDLSPAMLARAQARLAAAPPEIAARLAFRRGDLTSLDLKRTFDVVICSFFTLSHLPGGAGWRNSFKTLARHLEPGGTCAVHLPLAGPMRQPAPDPKARVVDQPLPSGGRLQMHVLERRFREDIGRFDQVVEYVERDPAGAVSRRSSERLTLYVADPQPAAEAAGLTPAEPPRAVGGSGEIWIFRRT